VVTPNKYRR